MKQLSPMMRQYVEMKQKYSDCILLYRLGDFYEMFFEDAITASAALDLTLTGRDCGLDERAPMCGVPYHSVDNYIRRLIENGFKVAVCEQLTEPNGREMVQRDVVRVITPGTVVEDNILEDKKSNYLVSVTGKENGFGIAWADISTGEFNIYEYLGENYLQILEDFLTTVSPSEIIVSEFLKEALKHITSASNGGLPKAQAFEEWSFDYETAYKTLLKQFKVKTLDAFECADKKLAVSAAGAATEYFLQTQKRALIHINKLTYFKHNSFMFLDRQTRRNLELTETVRGGKKRGSVLWLLDKTKTSMGGRELRRWVEQPLQDGKAINRRLDGTEEFFLNQALREAVLPYLTKIRDIERLSGKISYGNVTPRDCIALKESLEILPDLKELLKNTSAQFNKSLLKNIGLHTEIYKLLDIAIDDNPPALLKDGGFIKSGYNIELDGYKSAQSEGKQWLANLEFAEREATGIKTLKVGFNKVFGYYIEVTKSLTDKVPFRYQRKQTLTSGERFITEELKEIEEKILGAEEKSVKLEQALYTEIRERLLTEVDVLQQTAKAVAGLDAIISLAAVAAENNYVKPSVSEKYDYINIKEGRHPIVEQLQKDCTFVANDTLLDCDENRVMVITGPNMAGKSTYMRQVAVITLLAHIGSFVPASEAKIALTDRIFTRVGASDDLISGQSTFMVEMIEVATILNNATKRSLLILDEIGRGTSTLDGLSIAWAVMEDITKRVGAKTLFATHFHELAELESILQGVKNYRILIKEIGGTVLFLHKIVRGGANKSFGIEVASLAGIPQSVVNRAKGIMEQLEASSGDRDTNSIMLSAASKNSTKQQLSLFDENENAKEIVRTLKDLNLESSTPIQAFAILMDLKEKVK